jgi:putative ABC transport system permease protein
MIFKLLTYAWRGIMRNKGRSMLTVIGIAAAMFLFTFIEGLQNGVTAATESSATQNMLVVYQRGRFCPATSSLPERYQDVIARMPEVQSVLPVKIFVNNCRASLDSITFKGVPEKAMTDGRLRLDIEEGSIQDFNTHTDGALVGKRLASRRNLKPGGRFKVGDVDVRVSGIFSSDVPGEDNLAYSHLEFLQRARGVDSLGRVTQFEVALKSADTGPAVAKKIDANFKVDEVPTDTKTHKAHIAAATGDLLNLIKFTRWLGLLCVLVVLALTANTIYVMVQDRVREHAVLQTLGFRGRQLLFLVLAESLLLSVLGGALGTGIATAVLRYGNLGIGAEGVQVSFLLSPIVIVAGLAASAVTGFLAGILPAIQAAFAPIVDSLRKV